MDRAERNELVEKNIGLVHACANKFRGKGAEYDIRKYAHMFEYCMLGITSMLFMRELLINRLGTPAAPLSAWVFSFLYACSDELHQYFVPGRAALLSDVAIDAMGFLPCVAAVYLVLWAVRRLRN